jgi:hypothetical protein
VSDSDLGIVDQKEQWRVQFLLPSCQPLQQEKALQSQTVPANKDGIM